jgi:hypothetical protein
MKDLIKAVAWWSYGINGTWDGFARKRPDDDVYDEGTLTKLFTFPPIHDIEAIENRVAEACAWAVEHESQDSSRYDFAFAIRDLPGVTLEDLK